MCDNSDKMRMCVREIVSYGTTINPRLEKG